MQAGPSAARSSADLPGASAGRLHCRGTCGAGPSLRGHSCGQPGTQSLVGLCAGHLRGASNMDPAHCYCCSGSKSHIRLFATPWIALRQASLSFTTSRSLLKFMFIEPTIAISGPRWWSAQDSRPAGLTTYRSERASGRGGSGCIPIFGACGIWMLLGLKILRILCVGVGGE